MRRTRRQEPSQIALPWPGSDKTCPRCHGTREVYYRATPPGVEIVGGKRMPCPTCQAVGTVRAPLTTPVADPPPPGTALPAPDKIRPEQPAPLRAAATVSISLLDFSDTPGKPRN